MAGLFLTKSRHGSIYYFRRRVPQAAQQHIGRRVLVHSLETSDRRAAVIRSRALATSTAAAGAKGPFPGTGTGKAYGATLNRLGFHEITVEDPATFNFMRGDVMVMQPHKGGKQAGQSPGMMENGGYPISCRVIFGLDLDTVKKGQHMSSTVIKSMLLTALFATCTTVAAASGNQPPRFVTVPALGLRVPFDRLNLDPFPEDIRATCDQIADNEQTTGRMWIFGRAKDAASTYFILTGYFKRRSPDPERRLYEIWDDGAVFTTRGNKCGGDPNASETFDARDPNADNDGNVPIPILRELARDLAIQTVRAFGGPDKLRAAILTQRIDFDTLSPELQAAFKPYFSAAK